MEKITVRELFRALKKNIIYLLIPTLLMGFLAYELTGKKRKVEYKAQASLMIVPEKKEELTYNKMMQNEKLTNIYSQILTSEDLYESVVKKNGLDESAKELKEDLKPDVNASAGIIGLEFSAGSQEKAVSYLTMICEEFRSYVKDYTNMDNLTYLQKATAPKYPKKKSLAFGIFGAILGLFIGVLFVFIREINSKKIKDFEYIEDLGLEVLGEVNER